jgi:nitroimidazol reductase NimA-like FMN-containing flavoprotein (pyridoxamine 5'-phosphate oxidase superfamily)
MAATAAQQAFLESHRLVIVGIPRDMRPPHLSPVYYAMDGNDILISTTASRFKARAVRRNEATSLCVLAEEFPFPYLLVYGKGTIEESGATDVMRKVGGRMSGNPIPPAAMPAIEERARKEGRVVLRVRPAEFFSTMPLAHQAKGA